MLSLIGYFHILKTKRRGNPPLTGLGITLSACQQYFFTKEAKGVMGVVVPGSSTYPVSSSTQQAVGGEVSVKMASVCWRKLGFLPATLKQSPCIMVPFRMDAQSFHSSRRCLEEVEKKAQPGEQTYRHVEYMPPRRFKTSPNPVAIAWVIGLPSAFALFFLAKRQVEKKRVKQMKARRQMMAANKEAPRH